MTLILLAGALAGLGALVLVSLLLDPRPNGAAGLARLDGERRRAARAVVSSSDRRHDTESAQLHRLGAPLMAALEERGLSLPAALRGDLALVGRSVELHLAMTLIAALLGFLAPLVFAMLALVAGISLGVAPLWLTLAGAAIGALLPSLTVRSQASDRRRDFRHVVGSYLDLVAMSLAGGRGVPEALQAASSLSDDWAMVRLRDALENARLQGGTAWSALGALGEELRVDELRELSGALALVADDGAKIRDSLSARAATLRTRELSEAEGQAEERSQSMLVAQLLLCAGFLVFLIYPAIARVLG